MSNVSMSYVLFQTGDPPEVDGPIQYCPASTTNAVGDEEYAHRGCRAIVCCDQGTASTVSRLVITAE